MQDLKSTMVLLAYPNEPGRVTQEQVRNFEGPGEHWNLYMEQIIPSINYYGGVSRCHRGKRGSVNNYADIKSPNTPILRNLLLSTRIGSFNHLEFYRWFHRQSNSDNPRLLINDISLQSEESRSIMNQDVDIDNDVPLDLSIRSRQSNQDWTLHDQKRVMDIPDDTISESSTDMNWTLKHRQCSPGLIELLPNTEVYIEEAELVKQRNATNFNQLSKQY